MFTDIPFTITRPLDILEKHEVDLKTAEAREVIFSRNINAYLYADVKNTLLEKKQRFFQDLGVEVEQYLKEHYPELTIKNLSLFGSSLAIEDPGDYDFLAITNGRAVPIEEPVINLKGEPIRTGISIKGVDNYRHGFDNKEEHPKGDFIERIIDRTAISLYRRHIPLKGNDFVKNEHEFLKNAPAQVSDLLNNAYRLFYHDREGITDEKRARKLMSRSYEASAYLSAISDDQRAGMIREEIYHALINHDNLKESKAVFMRLGRLYEDIISDTDR